MTQLLLQNAVVAELKALFSHDRLKNSRGIERAVEVFAQDVPVRQDEDEQPPEAYITVRLMGGEITDEASAQEIDVVLLVCVHDQNPDRQGYRDALHIQNEAYRYFAVNGIVGKKYQVLYPIRWETQDGDTHPFYFTGMALKFEAQAIHKEMEL